MAHELVVSAEDGIVEGGVGSLIDAELCAVLRTPGSARFWSTAASRPPTSPTAGHPTCSPGLGLDGPGISRTVLEQPLRPLAVIAACRGGPTAAGRVLPRCRQRQGARASPKRRDMSCTPTGRPESVRSHGTAVTGWPVRLAMASIPHHGPSTSSSSPGPKGLCSDREREDLLARRHHEVEVLEEHGPDTATAPFGDPERRGTRVTRSSRRDGSCGRVSGSIRSARSRSGPSDA